MQGKAVVTAAVAGCLFGKVRPVASCAKEHYPLDLPWPVIVVAVL